ncbi:MAG: hypothetical protein ABIZ80_00970 [Bryobacteraceae bacterium]
MNRIAGKRPLPCGSWRRVPVTRCNSLNSGGGKADANTANYFLGNDPNRWVTDAPTYARVQYHDVYPGIDLLSYGAEWQLDYDFVVAPNVVPSQIRV